MDFVSLPEQFKLPILKKLHWRDLNNLKLTCKDLYFTVVKNIGKLDRPKVGYLKIYYSEDKILGVDYQSMHHRSTLGTGIIYHVEFCDDHEYDIFLKDKIFTEIRKLVLENVTSGEIINVENIASFMGETLNVYNFNISLSSRTLRSVDMNILRTGKVGIPYNDILIKKESLGKIGLFKKDGCRSIIKKITMDVVTGNSMLEYGNTSTDPDKPISIQITDQLCELGFFDFKNRCDIGGFTFKICWGNESDILEENFYRELYDKVELSINSIKNFDITYYPHLVSLNCSKCSRKHTNFINYDKSQKNLRIILH
uniref:F-box domain-containing protein n=1 Tax=Strongyloides venezuelensis TaxID=75913 RepID=A0A0K0FGQ8_STRVS